ncbi:riboflavin synthase [Tunicatimonas pelagia]|uniref:riboflavin synthase n=1 Tax=Tunicatimonas pelagia TaxID=931531 RepID=UPI0026653EF4|nr:riboflavin synthase [Tunicatimonas pelagia]WKN46318.1 riboflavin synthase [Tunicatimonas pelagia]
MFTGIIETVGELVNIVDEGENKHLEISSSITPELKVDQSVSHNGVCLTVTEVVETTYRVTAVQETLKRSNLGALTHAAKINLERCMPANGRFDGHIVQGHVDLTASCADIKDQAGSWLFRFNYTPTSSDQLLVEKGSVTVNGVSLTCFDITDTSFAVAIIPYTYQHTNFSQLQIGDIVNLEFDIVGKYISRILQSQLEK